MQCIHCGSAKLSMTDQQTTEKGDAIVVYMCRDCKKLSTKTLNTSHMLDVREDQPTEFSKPQKAVHGLECPSCRNGTIEQVDDELRCMGECGGVWLAKGSQ